MVDFYKSPWDKIVHGFLSFAITLAFGLYGLVGVVAWFHSREYSTATRYMNSRSLLLVAPFLWKWEPIEGKPTWQDTQGDFYVSAVGAIGGLYFRPILIAYCIY